ncbi:Hsp20/alpha crystallin family protein [Curvibacter sp. APW13]|uniref:Hsp20/alpha crystallin family protein n=1 Tax=Curvibacter sp. APW13 TaxID=3077236 RepID=UPI0028DF8883|nr:Hsp20/alpha crystallin family protein [Curvibacter sp. APW13]MDT8991161.1 Hsp20/alpha crystallin family protein [Curvibacter sp. APW13]
MFFAATAQPRLHTPAFAAVDRSVQRFINQTIASSNRSGCAYSQDETHYQLELDLPGVPKDQLSISIEDNQVRIQSKEGAARQYRLAYEFAQEIDASRSQASMEHGVLTLKLAKRLPVSKASELNIQ